MNEQQSRRFLTLYSMVMEFWERRYSERVGGDFPCAEGADQDCRYWWERFGENLPLPYFLSKHYEDRNEGKE